MAITWVAGLLLVLFITQHRDASSASTLYSEDLNHVSLPDAAEDSDVTKGVSLVDVAKNIPLVTNKLTKEMDKVPVVKAVTKSIEHLSLVKEETSSVTEEKRLMTEDISSVAEEVPSVIEGVPSVTQDVPSVIKQVTSVTEEFPPVIDGVPSVTEEFYSETEGVPLVIEEVPSVTEGGHSLTEEVPSVTEKSPSVTTEYPSEYDTTSRKISVIIDSTTGEGSSMIYNDTADTEFLLTTEPTEEVPSVPENPSNSTNHLVQYVAAVTQYTPYQTWGEGGATAILDVNLLTITKLATDAAQQGADMIVFPEYGLTGTNLGTNRSTFKQLCQMVPDPLDKRVPCLEQIQHHNYKFVQALSCLALNLDIYIIVDLSEIVFLPERDNRFQVPKQNQQKESNQSDNSETVESDTELNELNKPDHTPYDKRSEGPNKNADEMSNEPKLSERKADIHNDQDFIAYNTQVVLDRTGAVVARYRKKHLFLEPYFEYGTEDDATALFTTDFGVTFTLQICFDIMYQSPGLFNIDTDGVRDVAMSTAWIDELPFLTAPQIFSGWSKGLKINLLVSNLFKPAAGEIGSGIFFGTSDREPNYTYDSEAETPLLLVDHVTTIVTGDLMMDFKEMEQIQINKRAMKLMKFIMFAKKYHDSTYKNYFASENYTFFDTIKEDISKLYEEVKFYVKNKKYVNQILKKYVKTQRQLVEFERYKNLLKCTSACKKIRLLIDVVKSSRKESYDENINKAAASKTEISKMSFTKINNNPDKYKNAIIKQTNTTFKTLIESEDKTKPKVFNSKLNLQTKSLQSIIHENISFYSSVVLNPSVYRRNNSDTIHRECCHGDGFCCEVSYLHPVKHDSGYDNIALYDNKLHRHVLGNEEAYATASINETYMLLAYNGTVDKGNSVYTMGTQVCAVVYCLDPENIMSCANVDGPQPNIKSSFKLKSISGYFDTEYIYPSVFDLNFSLVSNKLWYFIPNFNTTDGKSSLVMNGEVDNLLTAALFGRYYELDPIF